MRKHLLVGDPPCPRDPTPPSKERLFPPELPAERPRRREEIEDLLHALPDREDLHRLYDRKVPLDQIVRLLGRRVDRARIHQLLGCDDPRGEIRRILGLM